MKSICSRGLRLIPLRLVSKLLFVLPLSESFCNDGEDIIIYENFFCGIPIKPGSMSSLDVIFSGVSFRKGKQTSGSTDRSFFKFSPIKI